MRRRLDIALVIALAWLGVAIGLTVVFGPRLGLRGWAWLGVHHVLCVVGCSHELRRAWQRRKERLEVEAAAQAAARAAAQAPPG